MHEHAGLRRARDVFVQPDIGTLGWVTARQHDGPDDGLVFGHQGRQCFFHLAHFVRQQFLGRFIAEQQSDDRRAEEHDHRAGDDADGVYRADQRLTHQQAAGVDGCIANRCVDRAMALGRTVVVAGRRLADFQHGHDHEDARVHATADQHAQADDAAGGGVSATDAELRQVDLTIGITVHQLGRAAVMACML